VAALVDAAGTTKYAYAAGGQLWAEDGPFSSDTVTNTYNNRLRTALALQQATGVWTNSFAYDAAKRLTNVTSQAGTFSYILGGTSSESPLPKKIVLPNTSYITNTYDTVARLTGTWLKNSSDSTLNSHEYTYNSGHQRTQQSFNSGSTYNYSYDPIGQLTFGDSATASEDRRYVYDAAWNLNYRTNNTTLYSFKVDTKNQLTNATPVGTQAYDGNGNVTSSQTGSQTFSYDDENRLTTNELAYSVRSVFTYDGLGRLRQRQEYTWAGSPYNQWFLQATVRYVYDGMRVIQERNDSNTPTVSYTRGSDLSGSLGGAGGIGGLLSRSVGYSSGTGNWSLHSYYHADGNGNVTYLVNSSQGLAAKYRYDPYGNTISSSGSLASANLYRFSSKEIHVNSGLYYYGYRWYSPNLQRWLNRDPIGELGGINLYAYVGNNPINLTEINGLWTIGIGVRGGYGFFIAGDISLGFYFGHSKERGWSFGFMETTFIGAGGPPNMSAGVFGQWTNAKCVGQLKGLAGEVGASGGEGPGGGGDFIFGSGYQGGNLWGGITGGFPVEMHVGGTITSGWDSGKGWRY